MKSKGELPTYPNEIFKIFHRRRRLLYKRKHETAAIGAQIEHGHGYSVLSSVSKHVHDPAGAGGVRRKQSVRLHSSQLRPDIPRCGSEIWHGRLSRASLIGFIAILV